jgi:hypothetical protein
LEVSGAVRPIYGSLGVKRLKAEHLRVLENVVQRIFGPERENITGDWAKLHNVELDDLCF